MHYKVYGYQGGLLLSFHFEVEVFGVTVIELLVPHLLLRHLSALSPCLHTFGPKVLRRLSPLLSQQICFPCLCRVIMVTLKTTLSSVASPFSFTSSTHFSLLKSGTFIRHIRFTTLITINRALKRIRNLNAPTVTVAVGLAETANVTYQSH